jgi:anaerobic selenocysteine-containing dehydrogenase
MHPEQMTHMGLVAGQRVDVTAVYASGDRVLNGLKLMPFDLPLDCVAAYYPEANDLIPLEHHVPRAHTPAYKSIPVRIRASV